jgi:hypothetical protein
MGKIIFKLLKNDIYESVAHLGEKEKKTQALSSWIYQFSCELKL